VKNQPENMVSSRLNNLTLFFENFGLSHDVGFPIGDIKTPKKKRKKKKKKTSLFISRCILRDLP